MILDAVRRGLGSKTALMKETDLEESVVVQTLAGLVEQKRIIETKIGKRLKYTTLEQEFDIKLKANMGAQVEKDHPKKGKKSVKKALDERPEPPTIEIAPEPVKEESSSPPVKPEPREKLPPSPYDFERLPPLKSKTKGRKAREPTEPEPIDSPEPTVEDNVISTEHHRKKKEKVPPSKEKKGKGDVPSKKAKPEKIVAEPAKEESPDKAKEDTITESKSEKAPPRINNESEKISPKIKKEPEKEPPAVEISEVPPEEPTRIDDLPVIRKTFAELSEDEVHVLDAISEEGMTVSGIQSKVGKHIKRFALLRALRVLIDSGHVGILTKGRLELYQKIKVQKMDKMKQENNQKEVK
jgi:hypothetical protein